MNLFDAFRVITEQQIPNKPNAIALLACYAETAIRQQSSQPLCTVPFLQRKLDLGRDSVKAARKHLLQLGLITDVPKQGKAYVRINFFIPELRNSTPTDVQGSSDLTPTDSTSTDVQATNTYTLKANAYSSEEKEEVTKTKTKTTHVCVSDPSKGLEEERQIADGKNQIAKEEKPLIDEVEVSPADVRFERENQMADSQMADGKDERQDGEGEKRETTREQFSQWLADWLHTDLDDPVVSAWIDYENLYGNYVRIDYGRYQKALEAKADYWQQELDFAKVLSIVKPCEHNKKLRRLWGDITRKPNFELTSNIFLAIDFLRAYADMETILTNWNMVELLTPTVTYNICKHIELLENMPTFNDVKELFNFVMEGKL